MKQNQRIMRCLNRAASIVALSAGATFGSGAIAPASAAEGIYGGGANLAGLAFRALADCYHGTTPDGVAVTSPACNTAGRPKLDVEALYAATTSFAGRRAFITNDPFQLVARDSSPHSLPQIVPLYRDTTGFLPNVYPYPRLDFGISDDPLPDPVSAVPFTSFAPATGWESLPPPPATPITSIVGAATPYNTLKLGRPIQVPGAIIGINIAVNVPKTATPVAPWQISYQGSAAIHLSQPQICAIFSAAVANWNDSSTVIAYRDNANALQSELFRAGNTPSGLPYSSASRPITIVYRSDIAGTTLVFSRFLTEVCPFFNDGANKYQEIFAPSAADIAAGYKKQPSDKFTDLIANINKAFPARAATTAAWVPVTSNGQAAAAVSNYNRTPASAGRISYVSSSFTRPYYKLVTAPFAAAIQDEAQRLAGGYHPSAATPFILPGPTSFALAWSSLTAPATVAAAQNLLNWDVYAQTHLVFGGQAKSVLATPTRAGAYPITGTAYIYVYSCYADPAGTRVPAIANFLSWLYGGSQPALPVGTPATSTRNAPGYDSLVRTVLNSNGFAAVPALFGKRIQNFFVANAGNRPLAIEAFVLGGPQKKGCRGVTGGGAL